MGLFWIGMAAGAVIGALVTVGVMVMAILGVFSDDDEGDHGAEG